MEIFQIVKNNNKYKFIGDDVKYHPFGIRLKRI